jgi:peptide-methionine (S)-S-oxide reductase
MRQGNDVGTQYRPAAYWYDDAQGQAVESSRAAYERALMVTGHGAVTSDVGRVLGPVRR